MYIHSSHGLGAPQPTTSGQPLLRQRPPLLAFVRVRPFAFNAFTLTLPLKQTVKQLAESVKASWRTTSPIGLVRLVGHTDSTGTEAANVTLGTRRAEAVRDELYSQLTGYLDRVLVQVDPSPGKSQPAADNRTASGRAANRRVEVFVEPPLPSAPKPKPPRKWPPDVPDPDRGEPWDPYWFRRGLPDPLEGKTPRQFLMDVCERKFGKGTCKEIVDRGLSFGCKGIAALFERLGGAVSASQKEEIQRQCRGWADKPL